MENALCLVYVTTPTREIARDLAQRLLEKRLVACANILPGLESHYRWEGKLERSSEVLLLAKTLPRHRDAIEAAIRAAHPYELPGIAFYVGNASAAFADWVHRETDRGTMV